MRNHSHLRYDHHHYHQRYCQHHHHHNCCFRYVIYSFSVVLIYDIDYYYTFTLFVICYSNGFFLLYLSYDDTFIHIYIYWFVMYLSSSTYLSSDHTPNPSLLWLSILLSTHNLPYILMLYSRLSSPIIPNYYILLIHFYYVSIYSYPILYTYTIYIHAFFPHYT